MKTLLTLLFFIPIMLFAQQDSMFYDSGALMNQTFRYKTGIVKSISYFYETGEFKGESFYDTRGVLLDGYTLNTTGDTISKSKVPEFNAQPKKDLSHIVWKERDSGISIFIEEKGKGKKFEVGDKVDVWYIGYFEDGSQFDNSGITQSTIKFMVGGGRMLKSFENGVLEFRSGGAGYIRIPYQLAFGEKVMGNLPAKSNLIYYIKPQLK